MQVNYSNAEIYSIVTIILSFNSGSEYHGYSSDITRTWPVNGKFTDPQRVLYEVLLEVQKTLINICKEFPTVDQLLESMYILLGRELSSVHLIPTSLSAIEKARVSIIEIKLYVDNPCGVFFV